MNDDIPDIPEFLRISAEERRAAWIASPPKPWPKQSIYNETTERLRAAIEAEKKAKEKPKNS